MNNINRTIHLKKEILVRLVKAFFSEDFENYEELGALLIGQKIDILKCKEDSFDKESSKQGRNFGITGGVASAVSSLAEGVKSHIINGLDKNTIKELRKFAKDGKCEGCNLIEVMGCTGGCIGGNATINMPKISTKIINDFVNNSKDLEKENYD